MTKLLFFLVLAVVAYLVLRGRRAAKDGRPPPGESRIAGGEAFVACHRCGVHVPLSESIDADGNRYCSEEHSRLG